MKKWWNENASGILFGIAVVSVITAAVLLFSGRAFGTTPFTDGPDPVGNEFFVTIEEIPNETPSLDGSDACQLMTGCIKGQKTVCNYYMMNYEWHCKCRVTKEKC